MTEVSLSGSEHAGAKVLGWTGFILLLALVLIRTMVEHEGFPMWSSDPFVFSPPVIGLTPTMTILLNLGVVLSACLVLTSLLLQRIGIGCIRPSLLVVGATTIVFHAYTDFETVLPGSNILATLSTLYIASFAHRFHGLLRLVGATVLSIAVLFVTMGAYEMFVTHPATVLSYEQTRDSFLAARGWSEGSFETLAYERRLYQAEPIVWFGLTNVFASFCGACAAGLVAMGWKSQSNRLFSTLLYIAGMCAFFGLLLSGAKGGVGAFALGLGFVYIANKFTNRKIDGRALVLICTLILVGLVVRGLIGEGLGERSLLFRWQYMAGSVRIFLANWMGGVGPGHFQDAYAFYKPALSPENVASPHNFSMNLIATLGLGGVALTAMCVATIARIRPCSEDSYNQAIDNRKLIQGTLFVIAVSSVVSIRLGSPAMDSNLLMIQVLGSLLWAGLAYLIVRELENESVIRWGLFAAGSVLAIHSMIEVSATWYVSGLLVALMIGSSCTQRETKTEYKNISRLVSVLLILCLLGCVGMFGVRAKNMANWEHELSLASQPALVISNLRSQLDSLEHSQSPSDILQDIAIELSDGSNTPDASLDWIIPQLNEFERDGRKLAFEHLVKAAKFRPTHTPTWIEASNQLLWQASFAHRTGSPDDAQVLWDRALELLTERSSGFESSSDFEWVGNVWRERTFQFPDDPNKDQWLTNTHSAWLNAYERSPYTPQLAFKLMILALDRDQHDEAAHWASVALLRHEQSRLDPLRGLDEDRFMRAQEISRSGSSTSTLNEP